jgi:chromosome segregation ATPase
VPLVLSGLVEEVRKSARDLTGRVRRKGEERKVRDITALVRRKGKTEESAIVLEATEEKKAALEAMAAVFYEMIARMRVKATFLAEELEAVKRQVQGDMEDVEKAMAQEKSDWESAAAFQRRADALEESSARLEETTAALEEELDILESLARDYQLNC